MKLNFKVKDIKVVDDIALIEGKVGFGLYTTPSVEIKVGMTGEGVKDSNTIIELSHVSEELHNELLSVINKIENKLNEKGE